MNPDLLARAVALATGEAPSRDVAETLADLLGVREELLAYLVLRQGAFASSPKSRAALAQAVRRRPPRRTNGQASLEDPALVARQNAELDRRMKAVIELEGRESETLLRAERALRDRVLSNPPAAYDAHLRIRIEG